MAKGPRVNIYEAQESAQAQPGGGRASPDVAGAGIARAIGAFGSDLGAAGQEYLRQQEKERLTLERDEEERAKAGASVALARMGSHLDEREQAIREEVGENDPTGYAGRVNTETREAYQGMLDTITHPKAKLYAETHMATFGAHRFQQAMVYERAQRDNWGTKNVINATEQYGRMLATDPDLYEPVRDAMLEMVNVSVSGPLREKQRDYVDKQLRTASAEGRMARDPGSVYAATSKRFGVAAVDPAKLAAEPTRVEKVLQTATPTTLFDAVIHQESRGRHYDDSGALTQSKKGALGISQVMPATGFDPGYGVAPLKDQSEAEYRRFGQDYLSAMLKEFGGDTAKALAAYNAGPGAVGAAVKRHGKDWLGKMPAETRAYVEMITARVAYPGGEPVRVASASTGTMTDAGTGGPIDVERPMLQNDDGSTSTERTITIEAGGRHFLIPTIVDGEELTEPEAVQAWKVGRNKAVGEFATAEEADAAAVKRSEEIGRVRGLGGPLRAEDVVDPEALAKGKSGFPDIDSMPMDELVSLRNRAHTAMERDKAVGRAEIERSVQDAVAMAEDGKRPPNPLTGPDFVAFYGPVEGTRRNFDYQQLLVVADDIKGMAGMSNGEIAAMLKRTQSAPGTGYFASEQRNALRERAWQKVKKQREDDPAAYVINNVPGVKVASDRIFGPGPNGMAVWVDPTIPAAERNALMTDYMMRSQAEQQRLGLAKTALLPDAVESYIVRGAQLAAGSGDKMAAHINGLSQTFGKEYWPAVYRQVVGGKNGSDVPASFIVIPGVENAAGREEIARNDPIKLDALKKQVGDDVPKQISTNLQAALAPFFETMMPGAQNTQTAEAIRSVAEKIAYTRHIGGTGITEAVNQAAKVVVGHLDFSRSGSTRSYAVPKGEDVQAVAAGVQAATNRIGLWKLPAPHDASDSRTPDEQSATFSARVRARPVWVTDGDQKGLLLYTIGENGQHAAVRGRDGKQVRFDWTVLREFAAADRAAAAGVAAPKMAPYEAGGRERAERERAAARQADVAEAARRGGVQ